nr:LLM class flavin-dependent oxidoreductase [Geomicrobium sp. JCM 19038]
MGASSIIQRQLRTYTNPTKSVHFHSHCRKKEMFMKLSVLDSSPIAAGKSSQEALIDSATLAQAVEQLGYTRFWLTEHHDLNGLASSTPEVLLAWIGGKTSRIRLGTGAILLPHYKPLKWQKFIIHSLRSFQIELISALVAPQVGAPK